MMQISEVKHKLEFERIIGRIRHYAYSDLGIEKCNEIEFFTEESLLSGELDKVLQAKEIINVSGELPLDGLRDIRKSLSKVKIEGYFIGPEEFLYILDFLRVSRKVKKLVNDLSQENESRYNLIHELTRNLFYDKILEHNIEITIDENGEVKDTASAALSKIRKQINAHAEKLRKTLANILKRVTEKDYVQEEIVTQRDGRFVIPVKVENKRDVPGIIHSSSGTGATVFIEPTESINLNNELTELYFDEKREIEKILRELAVQLSQNTDEIRFNADILAELDFVQAKARYAIEAIASKPRFAGRLNLVNAFHPVLLQTHKRNEVVPLNLEIGEKFNTLIISGPNAGGKTVVLKTVGLIQLMLQSGILVPVNPESEFRLFEKIFISIGDEQSLENDLSTFSSHLRSIKGIVDTAGNDSLVLIDEIASGTDPVLGSALSSAILKNLSERGAVSIVTTHNSELKEFAYTTDKIENASLEFDIETLSPDFHFVPGVPGQSFTFEIAKKFDFPKNILAEAHNYLDENESRLEDLLKDLNETKQKYSILKNRFDIENARLTGLTNLYEKKVKELDKHEKELKFKAKLEAEKIIKDANKLIEKTIKEIREDKLTPKEIKTEFAAKSAEITKSDVEPDIEVLSGDVSVSDFVRIKDSHSEGEVIEIANGIASVNINGLMIKAKLNDLEKISRKISDEFSGQSMIGINDKSVEQSLDLRGKFSYEISDALDKFISESKQYGLKEVSIIHGKGTGKLRDEVKKYLTGNSNIKSFRLGNWNEGNTGVTIVEL